jgi:hypothetical protein
MSVIVSAIYCKVSVVTMHLSFVSTTPGRAGIPGGFDNKFVPERRAFDKKMQPESRAIDKRAKNDETGSQSI